MILLAVSASGFSSMGKSVDDENLAANGLFAGGGIIGALIVNWILNRLGRCRSIQIVCAICVISAAIQGGAAHVAMFLVGRFLNGVGVGMMQVTVPAYMVSRSV